MSRDMYFERRFEEFARVLDFLPGGKPEFGRSTYRAEPLLQLIGETYFTLLEAVARYRIMLKTHERVYVGKDHQREKVRHILGRVSYSDLTSAAKVELLPVVEDLVKDYEDRFVSFFNNAHPLTPRMHALELLPGIGKRYMIEILNAREKKTFESYEELQKRTGVPDPTKLVARRIVEELAEDSKYRIFTRPL
jgi:putative nucleotide binding protein